jgi:hypothetical protein
MNFIVESTKNIISTNSEIQQSSENNEKKKKNVLENQIHAICDIMQTTY